MLLPSLLVAPKRSEWWSCCSYSSAGRAHSSEAGWCGSSLRLAMGAGLIAAVAAPHTPSSASRAPIAQAAMARRSVRSSVGRSPERSKFAEPRRDKTCGFTHRLSSGYQPPTIYAAREVRCSLRKLINSDVTSSAWVQVMQCGPPFTTTNRAPLTSFAVRCPAEASGTMRSLSP